MQYNTGPNMDGNYFKDKNQATAANGSTMVSSFINSITKEMETVLAEAGLTPSEVSADTYDQLKKAIFNSSKIGYQALEDSSVANSKIIAQAVTTDKLATGAVTTDKVGSGAITTDKVATTAVTTEKIANTAVTKDKLNADMIPQFTHKTVATYNSTGTITVLSWTPPTTSLKVRVTVNFKVAPDAAFDTGTGTLGVEMNGVRLATIQGEATTSTPNAYASMSCISSTVTGLPFTIEAGINGSIKFEDIEVVYETIPVYTVVV